LKFNRNSALSASHLRNGNFAVDVDWSSYIERQLFAKFTIDIEYNAFAMDSKVNFVPFFVKDLSFAENKCLQFSTKVIDAKLDGVLAWVKGNLELRTLP